MPVQSDGRLSDLVIVAPDTSKIEGGIRYVPLWKWLLEGSSLDPVPREPISQIFESMPEFCPIDGFQKSRVRDQPVAADIIDIQGRGLRGGPKDDSQSFPETHGRL